MAPRAPTEPHSFPVRNRENPYVRSRCLLPPATSPSPPPRCDATRRCECTLRPVSRKRKPLPPILLLSTYPPTRNHHKRIAPARNARENVNERGLHVIRAAAALLDLVIRCFFFTVHHHPCEVVQEGVVGFSASLCLAEFVSFFRSLVSFQFYTPHVIYVCVLAYTRLPCVGSCVCLSFFVREARLVV